MEVDAPDVAGLYRRFAAVEAAGSSPTYERLCRAVAEHPGALALLSELPPGKRQPNLLLGVLRLLGADVADPAAALGFAVEHADEVRAQVLARSTQTNEVARCAVLLPALALVGDVVALLEIGASAGLCLRYERYRYVYAPADAGERVVGHGPVTVRCTLRGPVPVPDVVPRLVARLGLDPHPLDPADPETARWLRCLVWPEHTDRADRLARALAAAAADPVDVMAASAPADLAAAVGRLRAAAPGVPVVVTHSATLAYLGSEDRAAVAETCRRLGVRRIGLEGAAVAADTGAAVPDGDWRGRFLLTLDDAVLGDADPHGHDLTWWDGAGRPPGDGLSGQPGATHVAV